MKNISEAKKSEILRREDAVVKEEKRIKEDNKKLLLNIKEFNLLVDKKMAKFAEDNRNLDDKAGKLSSSYQEIAKQKIEYSEGILENKKEIQRLVKLSSSITTEQSELAKATNHLSKQKADLKLKQKDLEAKRIYAERKIKEFSAKIKKYFQDKAEAEDSIRESKNLSLSVGKREKEVIALQEVVEKREKKVVDETTKLSEWNDTLVSLKADLRDRQRLIDIEEKEVRERQRVIQKIRKEIYEKKEGN